MSERGSFVREGMIVLLARILGSPAIAYLHGASFVEFSRSYPLVVRVVLSRAGAVLVLTEASAARCRELLQDTVGVYLIRNSVECRDPRWIDKSRDVVFAGVVGQRKGVDVLLDAWLILSKEFPKWRLHIAGPRERSFTHVAFSSPAVVNYGAMRNAEIVRLLTASRIAVLPSRGEALPVFLLEAMSVGNAVISTKVGDIPSLVGESCGQVVTPGDVNELVDAFRVYFRHEELISAAGHAAVARIRHGYSVESQKQVLATVVQNVYGWRI